MSESSSPIFEPVEKKEAQVSLGTTESAGQSVDEGQGRIFPCEGCGADLKFHIGEQQLQCPFCGYEKAIEIADDAVIDEQDFHAMLVRVEELHGKDRDPDEGQYEVQCGSCAGTVLFVGTLTSTECPYCASPIQRDKIQVAKNRIPCDGVLPFKVEKETARINLSQWVKSRWFAPNDFSKKGIDGKFNGIYLPYWTYDSMTTTRYIGQRGEHYYVTVGSGKNRRRVQKTRWHHASGTFQRFFDDVLVLADQGLSRDMIRNLEPWPLQECLPYNQQVLAGCLAKTYDVGLEEGFEHARERIDSALRRDVLSRIGGDDQRIQSINCNYDAIMFKHLLLPVWLMVYRYQDKPFQVMINAATGEVQGERPWSWVKIGLVVVTTMVVLGVIVGLATAQ